MLRTVAVVALCSTTFTGVAALGELNLTYRNCENGSRQVSVTSMSPSFASIGTTTHISVTGISQERITSGNMSMTTMLGYRAETDFPVLDCTGDVARGGECNMSNSPGYWQDGCDYHLSREMCAKEMEALYGHASVIFDGLNFPMAAGSINIGMKFHFGGRGLGGDFFGRSETMISSVSKSGEKVFCFKIYHGKRDSSGMRALTYKDCGDSQTHGRIVELFPLSVKDGASTRLNIKAILDTSVKSAVGHYHVKTVASTLPQGFPLGGNLGDCFGDAGEPIPCRLSLGVPFLPLGTIKYTGMQFPMQKGPMSFNVDLSLNPLIPSWFARTKTRLMASTPDGETFFCLEVTTNCRNPAVCSRNALASSSHEQNSTDVAVVLV